MDNRSKIASTVFARCVLLCAMLLCFAGMPRASAQTGKVSVSLRNAPVSELFKAIEAQTDYRFSYRDAEIQGKVVSVNARNEDLKSLLTGELSKVGLQYTLVDKKLVIKPMDRQTEVPFTLTGKVTDSSGEPIINAAVMIKGKRQGTVTDTEGNFSIPVTKGTVLQVSSLGYASKEIRVSTQGHMDFVLDNDENLLDELVVVGYGTTSRRNLTTAISSVKAENMDKVANSNMQQMLMGKAAGLRANISSTQPGGYVDLSIRGGGTPIFIVDGVMMPSSSLEVGRGNIESPNSINRSGLAGLNPGDIESIEVLKDAAAAIYGINAANGVIMITTKQGSEGKTKVSFDSNYSWVRNYQFVEPLSSYEYMNFSNVFSKEYYLYNHDMYPYGTAAYDGGWVPEYTPYDIDNASTTNWLDYVLKPGSINNQTVTVSGGSKTVKYYLSGNYFDQDGTALNSGMTRYSLRTNVAAQLLPFAKLTTILNINQNSYLNANADGGGAGGIGKDAIQTALGFPPNYPVYDDEGNYKRFRTYANPAEMGHYTDRSTTTGWYLNEALDIDIIKGMLSLKGIYGINKETADRSLYIPTYMYWYETTNLSRGHLGYRKRDNQTIEGTVNFHKAFANVVTVDAVAGMGLYYDNAGGFDVDYYNANDIINADNLKAAEGPFYPTSTKTRAEKRSQFARASADFLGRYIVTATIRRDGTDKFFPGQKYALFPSFSFAWKITDEPFMKDVKWLNLLKVRVSWGKTGRDNLGTTLYGTYSAPSNYVFFGENTAKYIPMFKSGADYPDVTWEKTIMRNAGLDFYMFNNRVWGNIDVFRNDVTNLLGTAPGEPLNMSGSRPVNYGHYFRRGWDATINTLNVDIPSTFRWTSILTLTRYNSMWVEREKNYDYKEYQLRENEPLNAYYFYKTEGIINIDRSNMPESQKSLGENATKPGYPIIKDRNGDGVITTEDVYMENTLPAISIGLGNTLAYKNFDLDVFLYGQFGSTRYNYILADAGSGKFIQANAINSNRYMYTVWNAQTNPEGTRPGITRTVSLPGNAGTDNNRQDASFLRVRNITLGYTLPGMRLGSTLNKYLDNIRIYADVQNPFTFTRFSGADPEIYFGNSSSPAGYPMTRTYSLGAKINLK